MSNGRQSWKARASFSGLFRRDRRGNDRRHSMKAAISSPVLHDEYKQNVEEILGFGNAGGTMAVNERHLTSFVANETACEMPNRKSHLRIDSLTETIEECHQGGLQGQVMSNQATTFQEQEYIFRMSSRRDAADVERMADPIPSPAERFQHNLFKLPLELRTLIYDQVLAIPTTNEFRNQESLLYKISASIGCPSAENYNSVSVTTSRSWLKLNTQAWSWCCQIESERDRLHCELKRRFAEHTTFVISTSATLPLEFCNPDRNGRFDFLDRSSELQLLNLLEDDKMKPWLNWMQNVNLILLLSTVEPTDSPVRKTEDMAEPLCSARYATVAKLAWVLQNLRSLRKLDITVSIDAHKPVSEKWVWSLVAPLKSVSGIRSITINSIELVSESEIFFDADAGYTSCPSSDADDRRTMARQLKWEMGYGADLEEADESPEDRFPYFDQEGRLDACWWGSLGIESDRRSGDNNWI